MQLCTYMHTYVCAHIHIFAQRDMKIHLREVNKLPLVLGLLEDKVVGLLFMCAAFFFSLKRVGELNQCPFPGCDLY